MAGGEAERKAAQFVARNGALFEGLLRRREQLRGASPEYMRALMLEGVVPPADPHALARWESALDSSDANTCAEAITPGSADAMLCRLADRAAMLRASSQHAASDAQPLLLVLHSLLLLISSCGLSAPAAFAVKGRLKEVVSALAYACGGADAELMNMAELWRNYSVVSESEYNYICSAANSCALPPARRCDPLPEESLPQESRHGPESHTTDHDTQRQSLIPPPPSPGDKQHELAANAPDTHDDELMEVEQVSSLPANDPVRDISVGHMPDCVRVANCGTQGAYQPIDPSQQPQPVRRGDSEYITNRLQRLDDDLTGGAKRRQLEADRQREREQRERAMAGIAVP
jgi:hypothetical protein